MESKAPPQTQGRKDDKETMAGSSTRSLARTVVQVLHASKSKHDQPASSALCFLQETLRELPGKQDLGRKPGPRALLPVDLCPSRETTIAGHIPLQTSSLEKKKISSVFSLVWESKLVGQNQPNYKALLFPGYTEQNHVCPHGSVNRSVNFAKPVNVIFCRRGS